MEREQAPANEVALLGLPQPQRDVGLAHGKVEFVVGQDDLKLDIGIKLAEFGETRRQPYRAEAGVGGDPEQAVAACRGRPTGARARFRAC